ncbi:DUF2059 domain-containing protein [Methylorubrum sp. SB2]|uniref:DUF2059 domain-containing protein n=1 Tax=Methylorubrum subtropicum TaxID=3138812 RepID=UPI00313E791A
MRRAIILGLALFAALPASLRAEPATAPPASTKVDPARLALARDVIARAQGGREATLAAMKGPLGALLDQQMRQMGVAAPDKAQIMMDEVLMPILTAHYDEMLNVQALAYAAVFPAEDLRAIAAFYATPAGQRLAKAQPQLAQASLVGIRQWMAALMPEIQQKLAETAKAHGWIPGAPDQRPKSN